MTNTSDPGREAQEAAADLGQKAKAAMRAEARGQAEAARDAAAAEMQDVADAAEAAAGQFDPRSVQAQAVMQVADRIEGLARTLRRADPAASVQGVTRFARRNPAIFVAGAALLGFAATRFLKARDPQGPRADASQPDPWAPPQSGVMTERNGGPTHGA